MQRLNGWRLWVVISLICILGAELVVSTMSEYFNGKITNDYLLTGFVASCFVAPPTLALLSYLLGEFNKLQLQSLASSEQFATTHLNIAVEVTQMVIWDIDFVTGSIHYDKTKLKLLDMSTENPPDNIQNWIALVHPDDLAEFLASFQAAQRVGAPPFDLEYRMSLESGKLGWMHTRGLVIQRDSAGNPLVAAGSTMNITSRKQSEEKSYQNEILLRSTLESTDEGILMIAHDGHVLSANKRFMQLWQVPQEIADTSQDELLLAHVLDQLLDANDFLSLVKQLYESDEEARDVLRFKDGRVFARYTQSINIGANKARIWCFRDVTAQFKAQEELTEREKRLHMALDAAHMGVWEFSCSSGELYWSPEIYRHMGLEYGKPAQEILLNIVHPDDLNIQQEAMKEAIHDHVPYFAIYRLVVNNKLYWTEDRGEVQYDAQGNPLKVVGTAQDITARKLAEEVLEQTKERYDLATMIGKIGTWDWNPISGILIWSDETYRLMGFEPRSITPTYELYLGLVHPCDREYLNNGVLAAIHEKKPYSLDCRIVLGNGKELICHVNGKVEFDSKDQPTRMLGTIQNITERKKNELALKTESEKNFAFLRNASDGIHILDIEGNIIEASDSFCSMLGYKREEVIGMNVCKWEASMSNTDIPKQLKKQFESEVRSQFESLHRCKDGSIIEVEISGFPLHLEGRPVLFNSSRDITQRKQAEAALQSSEQKLLTILDNVDAYIYLKDIEGRYLFTNRHVRELWGAEPKDIVGFTDEKFFDTVTSEQIRLNDRRVLVNGEVLRTEETNAVISNGRIATFISTKLPLRREDGSIYALCGISTDITERKKIEDELLHKERYQRALLDNFPFAVWLKDPESNFLSVNKGFAQIFGTKDADELIGKNDYAIAPRELAETYRSDDRVVIETRQKKSVEEMIMTDGALKWFETHKAPVIDADGKLLGTVGFARDITDRKFAEQALRNSEENATNLATLLRLISDNVPDMIWAKDMNKRFLFANKAICDQLLSANDTNEPIGKDDMYFALRERQKHLDNSQWHTFGELCQDSDAITLKNGMPSQFDEFGNVKGKFLFLDVHKAPFVNDKGEIIGVVGSARDVTDKKIAEEKLQLASLVLENSSEALLVTDRNNFIVDVNPAFTRLTGYAVDEVIGKNPKFLQSGRHGKDFYREMWNILELEGQWQGEIWNRRKNGEIYAEWLTINSINHEDGTLHRRVALFSDITEKKKTEELIWNQANFDYLTKLPNRRMFRDRLSQDIKKSHRAGEKLALLVLDLDHFKEVNDTLGHDLGDVLLVEAARRITACVRESDTVARLGGDEFTIILADLEETSSVERVAEEIIHSLNQPFHLNGDHAYVSASIGIALYPDDANELEDLLKDADQAMYVSKRAGRNRFSYFTNAMQEIAKHRLQIISDLRIALAEAQFQLYYQPIVELATGKIHKAEALLRWFHPTRGMISPAEFIPLAEESGLIHELGECVFSESAKQVHHWRSLYGEHFQISVNVSPVQMQSKNNPAEWLHRLESMELSGQNFVFEITEGLLLDTTPNITAQLLAFRDAGVQVAIDDFGTGYSALSYLKKLDIDYLKIDQSFVRNLAPESSDLALCEAIVVMAHKLGLKVIAEGVETAEQNSLLSAIRCDYVQGYFNSKPLPAAQFETFMKQWK